MNLLFGNFDFEHHLGRSAPRKLSASVQRIKAELAYSLVTIAQPGDYVWAIQPPETEYRQHLIEFGLPDVRFIRETTELSEPTDLRPWGWSKHAKTWGAKNGWLCDCPDLAVVAMANSREFSSSLEREWNVSLPFAEAIRSLDELRNAIADATQETAAWVVKANFGMSARERVLGRGSPGPQVLQWVRKQLAQSGAVYFEPWVERVEELGFQFTVPPIGEPILEGITPLLTGPLGTYRGSRLRGASCQLAGADQSAEALEIAMRAAHRIQQLGYFGPLGIDAMLYRMPDGQTRWRPLQDINARLTMGRLALGLARFVRPTEHASWLHLRSSGTENEMAEQREAVHDSLPAGTRAIRTSPLFVGDRPACHRSFLIAAPSTETLIKSEATLTQLNHGRLGRGHP